MNKIQFQTSGRSMRWYEWVLMLLMLGLAAGVRAQPVYKCTDAAGAVAYQEQPCSSQQQEVAISIAPAPAHAASPEYSIGKGASSQRVHVERGRGRIASRSEPVSYECRVADGEVFYRHSPCPHSLSGEGAKTGKNRSRGGSQKLTVSARKVSREEACNQIHRAGAIGRAGSSHDEQISTYDRNLGRDVCN